VDPRVGLDRCGKSRQRDSIPDSPARSQSLYRLGSFITKALEWSKGSASSPAQSLPPGKTRYPLYRRMGGPQGRSGQVRKISPPQRDSIPDRPGRSQSLYRLGYSFITTALQWGKGSASRPGRSLPPVKTRYPLYRMDGWAPGPVWTGTENLAPTPGFDPGPSSP